MPKESAGGFIPRITSLKLCGGFTLIELLVVVAIVAILSVAVIITINPAELLKQARDSTRLSDLALINKAINTYQVDQSSGNFGNASTTYISIPDPTATSTTLGNQCTGLGLPSLPSGYAYHCSASSTYRNADGTGWIPINFSSISYGSPLGTLPVDPINTSSTREFYTYIPGGSWKLMAYLTSNKYQSNSALFKGGDGTVYETGTNLNLIFGGPMYGNNDLPYSEDIASTWGPYWYPSVPVSSDIAASPSGSLNADYASTTAAGYIYSQQTPKTYQNGSQFTFSAWMRSDVPDTQVALAAHVSGGWGTTKIVTLSSSWQRYSQTFTMTATGRPYILFEFGPVYTGVAAQPFYIWGSQITNTPNMVPYVRATSSTIP